jgi:D-glycero-alpha-D-manno-heptose-7-phosphate kinase
LIWIVLQNITHKGVVEALLAQHILSHEFSALVQQERACSMIVSRAPVRITLGGGGTNLASYYSKHGGFLIAGAINKYCTVLANQRFYDNIRLSYSQMETKDNVEEVEHRIFKAALRLIGIAKGIELHFAADVPAGCGLGTYSSFTVALLDALHAYKREFVSQRQTG